MTVLNKRPPDTFTGATYAQYQKISKADWADLFADIYRESTGEEFASAGDITAAEDSGKDRTPMMPIFFPRRDKLVHDLSKTTNLAYYAPIDAYRQRGWCSEVLSGEMPRMWRGELSYTGQGSTYAERVSDLLRWLGEQE
jgi:hypothetical protein